MSPINGTTILTSSLRFRLRTIRYLTARRVPSRAQPTRSWLMGGSPLMLELIIALLTRLLEALGETAAYYHLCVSLLHATGV